MKIKFKLVIFFIIIYIIKKLNGNNNLTIIKTMPRTQSAGKQITTIIIRNNREIDFLDWNKFYNSSYQFNYNLIPRVTITKVKLLLLIFYSRNHNFYLT